MTDETCGLLLGGGVHSLSTIWKLEVVVKMIPILKV